MTDDVVWEKRTERATIQVIATPNWKEGIPKNPKIPKWLVKIHDHLLDYEYCPTDEQLEKLPSVLPPECLALVVEAFKIKEEHNRRNLKNPEIRKKEEILAKLEKGIRDWLDDWALAWRARRT